MPPPFTVLSSVPTSAAPHASDAEALGCAGDSSLLLVQLSDSHLLAAPHARLMGMDTQDSLQRVIARVLEEQPRIDLLLASGDLSQDGSLASYQRFRQMTSAVAGPARWFAGNHDALPAMRSASEGSPSLEPVIDLGGWRVVLLDSTVPGAVHGYLAAEQLALLERALSTAGPRHLLICLHHHPVAIGSRWMDAIGLRNPEALFAVLDGFPQVRALLWGHIHQEFDQRRHGVRLLATPSTCAQFAPGSAEFQISDEAPGYRWLRLHADGRLETGVSRVSGVSRDIREILC